MHFKENLLESQVRDSQADVILPENNATELILLQRLWNFHAYQLRARGQNVYSLPCAHNEVSD